MNIRTILNFIDKGNKKWFDRDIEKSLAFVQSFEEPKSLWCRSYYQYKCKNYDIVKWKRFFFSVVSVFVLPFCVFFFLLIGIKVKFKKRIDCVGDCIDVISMIPESLKKDYQISLDVYYNAGFGLSLQDLKYLSKRIFPYIKEPFFLLHIIFKVARYSNIIRMYSPSVIICHNEYSFSSSALTDYCHFHDVTHINIQHGEKLINIRNAFFEYDKCYVWHEHYKNLYILLRCGTKPDNIIIETPDALKIDLINSFEQAAFVNYKYYLGNQSFEELQHIVESLMPLKSSGYSVKFRPHPRYTNYDDLKRIVSTNEIEWPSEIDITTSIASCDYVIGSFSAVLLQSFMCGRHILIDDVTYGNRIELQKKARHIIFSNGDPELLSSHIAHKVEQ